MSLSIISGFIIPIKHQKNSKLLTYIKFYKNGQCKNFFISSNQEYTSIHDPSIGNWSYNDDNKLDIFEHEFKILSARGDTIYMINNKNEIVLLFKYRK